MDSVVAIKIAVSTLRQRLVGSNSLGYAGPLAPFVAQLMGVHLATREGSAARRRAGGAAAASYREHPSPVPPTLSRSV